MKKMDMDFDLKETTKTAIGGAIAISILKSAK